MSEVRLTKVSKMYPGGVVAVDNLSLSIAAGEFLVLVGPSGCGKSTTLRMVAGLEQITSGTIEIGDRVVNDLHPKDRDIAMVFQNYALYPHMTVYRNMAFALKLRKTPKAEIDERVHRAADLLGIRELLERRPGQLSGGQRQRVALGRAIVREPKAFLFDEPLSNLDAKLRVVTRGEIKALHRRLKTTSIYVTHDQEEAMTLGDRVVVLSAGKIQQADSPLELYRKPANRFVGSFIGTPPLNLLEGELVAEDGRVQFVESAGASNARERFILEDPGGLDGWIGKGVTLGLRPSAFHMHSPDSDTGAEPRRGTATELEVEVVEPLGDQVDLLCRTAAGASVVARVGARCTPPAGSRVRFHIDLEGVHFFERGEYGLRIETATGR